MARPSDVWEFWSSRDDADRAEYIESLPEAEQEWATALFHYIDKAYRLAIAREKAYYDYDMLDLDEAIELSEQIENDARTWMEPPFGKGTTMKGTND